MEKKQYKLPPLTSDLVQSIIYAMENQESEYAFDPVSGSVVSAEGDFREEVGDSEDFISLPEWSSQDGFNLMQKFALQCEDQKFQNKLLGILGSHQRGVFRSFRLALEEKPDCLKQWYEFKEKSMTREIRRWYRHLALPIDWNQEWDEDEIVLEDFSFEEELDDYTDDINAITKSTMTKRESVISVDPNDDLAGFISYYIEECSGRASVLYYYVREDCRRLGLFDMMYIKLIEVLKGKNVSSLVFPVVGKADYLANRFISSKSEIVRTDYLFALE